MDDNPTNREIMCHYLKGWDVEVDVAKGGARALHMLSAAAEHGQPYQVALLDLLMPDMSGLELAGKIKADPALDGIHLLMISSVTWRDDRRQARNDGIAAFLTKPLKQSELFANMARLVGGTPEPDKAAHDNGSGTGDGEVPRLGLSV